MRYHQHLAIEARSAESVRLGHPDKLADRISDAILDAAMRHDKEARCAIETLLAGTHVVLAGELGIPREALDAANIARNVLEKTGYTADYYEGRPWQIQDIMQGQSHQIRDAVKRDGKHVGAGDQGVVYGHANRETDARIPLPRVVAHALTQRLDALQDKWSWLRPDGKAQVTIKGDIAHVVASTSHAADQDVEEVRDAVLHGIILPVLDAHDLTLAESQVNPGGRFTDYGPLADTGLTGRKLMVDSYGGLAPHGGGAWSGKDATKVDRSGAYYARYAAKRILEEHGLSEVTVCMAYAIGRPGPLDVGVDARSSEVLPWKHRLPDVLEDFDFSVHGMATELDLKRPIYEEATRLGHLGDPTLPWEAIP